MCLNTQSDCYEFRLSAFVVNARSRVCFPLCAPSLPMQVANARCALCANTRGRCILHVFAARDLRVIFVVPAVFALALMNAVIWLLNLIFFVNVL